MVRCLPEADRGSGDRPSAGRDAPVCPRRLLTRLHGFRRAGQSPMYSLFHLVEPYLESVCRWQREKDADSEEDHQHRRESPSPLLIFGSTTIQGECRTENDRDQKEGERDQRVREGLAVQQTERNGADAQAQQDDSDPHSLRTLRDKTRRLSDPTIRTTGFEPASSRTRTKYRDNIKHLKG